MRNKKILEQVNNLEYKAYSKDLDFMGICFQRTTRKECIEKDGLFINKNGNYEYYKNGKRFTRKANKYNNIKDKTVTGFIIALKRR